MAKASEWRSHNWLPANTLIRNNHGQFVHIPLPSRPTSEVQTRWHNKNKNNWFHLTDQHISVNQGFEAQNHTLYSLIELLANSSTHSRLCLKAGSAQPAPEVETILLTSITVVQWSRYKCWRHSWSQSQYKTSINFRSILPLRHHTTLIPTLLPHLHMTCQV